MKKRLIYFMVITGFTSFTLNAQNISYGLNGGINYYTMVIEDSRFDRTRFQHSASSTNLQYHFGVFIDYNLNEKIGVIGNIIYQNRSFQPLNNPDTSLKYIDISPLLKFDSNNTYGSGFYFKGGLRYSFLLSAKTIENKIDVKDTFNSTNLGLILGLGMDISKYIGTELIFDYSPSNAYKNIDGIRIKSNIVGANLRVIVDLEKLLKK